MPNQGMQVKIRTSNTILYCRNWKETVRFYTEGMKFTECFAKDDWFIELKISADTNLSLADASRCTIAAGQGQGVTLSFGVDDLRAVFACFEELGRPHTEIVNRGWRAPYFYAFDPEGHRIEFWSESLDD